MFTAVVLLCAQANCFAIGGPAFATEEQCIADFMQNGVISLQVRYPSHTIVNVVCHEWQKKVQS